MTAEQQTEYSYFRPNWQKALKNHPQSETYRNQVHQEAASWIAESHKLDVWSYGINKKGELLSLQTGELVKKVIGKQRSDYILGEAEFQAVCQMEDLIGEDKKDELTEDKTIVWVSDPYEGIYKDTKVVISEVQRRGSERFLLNRAILLDSFDTKKCRQFASNLGLDDLSKLCNLRANPFLLEQDGKPWTQTLSEAGKNQELDQALKKVDLSEDFVIKKRSLIAAQVILQDLEESDSVKAKIIPYERFAQKLTERAGGEVFGTHASSCPIIGSTILEKFLGNAQIIKTAWHEGECRLCNQHKMVGECRVCKSCEDNDTAQRLAKAA